jgi:hypothetical protein
MNVALALLLSLSGTTAYLGPVVGGPRVRSHLGALSMTAESVGSGTSSSSSSLEEEFESAKAASQVASEIAALMPMAATPARLRKRDRVAKVWRRTKSLVGLGSAVKEAAEELVGDSCDVDEPEVCEDEGKFRAATRELKGLILQTLRLSRGTATADELAADDDAMEAGWQQRGSGSAFKRTTEVWGFLAKCALRILKARKKAGKSDEEVSAAKTAAAEFIRDGLFTLGPTFVSATTPPATLSPPRAMVQLFTARARVPIAGEARPLTLTLTLTRARAHRR